MKKEETVKCVKSATWNLAWKDYRNRTILIIIVSVLASILIIYFFEDADDDKVRIFLFIPLIYYLIFIYYYKFLRKRAHKKFMIDFALMNKFDYKEEIPLSSVKMILFGSNQENEINHVVFGKYNNQNIRFFNYQRSRDRQLDIDPIFLTVLEIFFEKVKFPSIILRSRKKPKSFLDKEIFNFDYFGKGVKEIKLEDEFKDNFALLCAEGYVIEVLQIFKPETLRLLKEKGLKFNIEMIDDRLYIYESKLISTRNQLYELYEIAQTIIDSLGPLLNRLSNDFEVLHKYYKKCGRIKR